MENAAEHGSGAGSRSVASTPAAAPSVFTEEQTAQLQAAHELAIKQAVDQAVTRTQQEIAQRDARIQFLEQVVTAQAANTGAGSIGRAEEHAAVKMELGKLPHLAADGKNWQTFSLKFKAHIANTSEKAYEELERLEDPGEEAKLMTRMDDGMRALARKIHFGLTMLTEGTSLTLVDSVRDKNGFKAYGKLSARWDPSSKGRNLVTLNKLLQWEFGSGRDKMLDALAAWEKAVERWEFRAGEFLQDSVKQSVISERAPAEVKSHLLLNAGKFKTFEEMKALLLSYLTEKDETADMDISALHGGKYGKKGQHSKGGKPGKDSKGKDAGSKGGKKGDSKGKDANKAKGGKKGKQDEQGKGWQQGWSQSRGSWQQQPAAERFEGYCGKCGAWGHKQRDCRRHCVHAVGAQDHWWTEQMGQTGDGSWTQDCSGWWSKSTGGTGDCSAILPQDADEQGNWIFTVAGEDPTDERTSIKLSPQALGTVGNVEDEKAWWASSTSTPGKEVGILMNSGSTATCCGPKDFPHVPITNAWRQELRNASGKVMRHYGEKVVKFQGPSGETIVMKFMVLDVVRPICLVSECNRKSIIAHFDGDRSYLEHKEQNRTTAGTVRPRRLGLTSRIGLFFLQLVVAQCLGTSN